MVGAAGEFIVGLAGAEAIGREHLLEAIQHRRLGAADNFWGTPRAEGGGGARIGRGAQGAAGRVRPV